MTAEAAQQAGAPRVRILGPRPETARNAALDAARRYAPVSFFIAVIVVWELAVQLSGTPSWLLPSPSLIVEQAWKFAGLIPRHVLATALATVIGFALAAVGGIALGVAIGSIRLLEQTIYPSLVAIQSVPKVALAPLFLMWIGYGMATKVAIVFLVAVFPIVVSTATGIKSVPENLVQMIKSFKARPLTVLIQIRLPYSVPFIFVGLKVAVTLATSGAVVGEFVGSTVGLGVLITQSTQQFNTSLAFAAIVLLALLSMAFYYVIDLAERVLFPWSIKGKTAASGAT